jgi:sugar/nucleoside kinase (ribokinase family)
MEKTGITVAGSMVADLYYEIDTYPRQGTLTNIRATHSGVGGTGNLILDLARLDPALPVRVSALAGLDAGGDMMAAALSRFPNIDLRGLVRAGVSSVDHVMEPRDTKQRTFFYQAGANDVYDMSCIDWAAADAKIFHLEYLLLMARVDADDPEYGTHGARILHEARARGMQTSVDVVSERSERSARVVSAALRYTDYCTINEYEAETVTGIPVTDTASARKALEALRDLGVARWAVIHSPAMGWGLDCRTGDFFACPSLRLPEGFIRGTTGAGDAYCAGILYGAYTGLPLPEALRFACAAAACSLSGVNGTEAMPEAAGVWEVYERYCERGEGK